MSQEIQVIPIKDIIHYEVIVVFWLITALSVCWDNSCHFILSHRILGYDPSPSLTHMWCGIDEIIDVEFIEYK